MESGHWAPMTSFPQEDARYDQPAQATRSPNLHASPPTVPHGQALLASPILSVQWVNPSARVSDFFEINTDVLKDMKYILAEAEQT